MKAVVFERYGLPDVLEVEEVEIPTPQADEVLVKVHASSINSWDWELLRGVPFVNRVMFGLFKPKLKILGIDIAGTVEAVGGNVTRLQPGDEVYGDISGAGWGGFADYVCAREEVLAQKPASMSFVQAAAVPQAAVLALQGLRYKGRIRHGDKVLINGASGGVGTFAVQMAKSYGAEVTGVCSTGKMDLVRSLGADHVVDYTWEDFARKRQRYDLILDVCASRPLLACLRALNPEGRYVIVGGTGRPITQTMLLGPLFSRFGSRKAGLLLHKPNRKDLDAMSELLDAGKVVPVIDRRYPLTEVADAMRYFGDHRARGKVVITIG